MSYIWAGTTFVALAQLVVITIMYTLFNVRSSDLSLMAIFATAGFLITSTLSTWDEPEKAFRHAQIGFPALTALYAAIGVWGWGRNSLAVAFFGLFATAVCIHLRARLEIKCGARNSYWTLCAAAVPNLGVLLGILAQGYEIFRDTNDKA